MSDFDRPRRYDGLARPDPGAGREDSVSRALRLAARCPEAARDDPDVVALVRAVRVVKAPVQKREEGLDTRLRLREEPL